jgi:hypothetical protein
MNDLGASIPKWSYPWTWRDVGRPDPHRFPLPKAVVYPCQAAGLRPSVAKKARLGPYGEKNFI